jgi:hypothetical protein
MKKFLVKLNRCPHCDKHLDYSSESANLIKTMECIFLFRNIHRSECTRIIANSKKLASISIKETDITKHSEISEYKTNKILF